MINPWSERNHLLTGRTRVRRGIEHTGAFSREPVLIAQVEESFVRYPVLGPESKAYTQRRWRDMRTTDLVVSLSRSEAA